MVTLCLSLFAVEEPGSKVEEGGQDFCACDYMVVLTQIRIILVVISKLFESFRICTFLGMRLVHVCHMTIHNLLCTQGVATSSQQ